MRHIKPIMRDDPDLHTMPLPPLSDEAAVEVLDFLHDLIDRFESQYASQILRYYDERSQHNIVQTQSVLPSVLPTDDPPF
jgi:hypothetical protein